jgi:hypothetical protein
MGHFRIGNLTSLADLIYAFNIMYLPIPDCKIDTSSLAA